MLPGFDFSSYDSMKPDELQVQTLTRNVTFAYLRAAHGLDEDQMFADARSNCVSTFSWSWRWRLTWRWSRWGSACSTATLRHGR